MSGPLHDPLVVNTQDNRCWVRRAWSRDGHGLYGLEGSPQTAEQTLLLMRELAEYGLRSMAFVLPVQVADGITRLTAPTQALQEPIEEDVRPQVQKLRALLAGQREVVDGEHYAVVHHDYHNGRDMPETGGAR